MGELQSAVEAFPIWKAIAWIFYPMAILIAAEIIAKNINDDDDEDGGKMIPVMQGAQN